MKLREIITQLMESISNGVETSKYQEIKDKVVKLVPYAEYEEEVVMYDLLTILKIANEGFWYASGDAIYRHSGDELVIDMANECFRYIELDERPSEEDCCWYEEIFDFKDYGKTYFATENECKNAIMKSKEQGKSIPLKWRSL